MIYGTSILTSSLLFFSLSTFNVESDCVAVPCMAKITTVNKCTHKDRQMEFKTLIITDVHMHTYKYDWVWENQSMSVQELKSILLLDIAATLMTLLLHRQDSKLWSCLFLQKAGLWPRGHVATSYTPSIKL